MSTETVNNCVTFKMWQAGKAGEAISVYEVMLAELIKGSIPTDTTSLSTCIGGFRTSFPPKTSVGSPPEKPALGRQVSHLVICFLEHMPLMSPLILGL